MDGAFQKSKLSLGTAFRIGTHGLFSRPIRLIVVIFLATVALSMFGLSITVALYDEETAIVQSVYEYDSGTVLIRENEDGDLVPFTRQTAEEIASETGKTFAYLADGEYLPEWGRFVPYVSGIRYEDYGVCMRTDPQSVCCATEAVLAEAGFTLTGRLPQNKNEIAINGCMLNTFLRAGYYDYIASPQYRDEEYRLIYEQDCIRSIRSAQELTDLSLKLYVTDPETGEQIAATVVGVVEYGACPNGHVNYEEELVLGLYDQLYVSEEFIFAVMRENYGAGGLGIAAVAGKTASVSEARSVYGFCLRNGFRLYSDSVSKAEEYRDTIAKCAGTFAGAGAAFAVFAVLLIYQFVSISIENKKMQVGILRALGARSTDVYKIFLSESLFLAMIYAVLAIPLTIALSEAANLVLKNGFHIAVSVLNFHWLTPVLIPALSIGITLLSVVFPIRRMAQRSPVDCIRDGG